MVDDTRDIVIRNQARIDALEARNVEMYADIKHIREVVDQAKGGWRMLMMVGGASAAVGAVAVKIIEWVKS